MVLLFILFYRTSKIIILTFMNVDGAFILAEIYRNQEDLRASVCWQQHADISQIYLVTNLGRCLSHVSHCHTPLKKYIKMSKWWVTVFQRRISSLFGLWILASRARAALFEYMPSVRVLDNITFCSSFANLLRTFHDFNHHSNQQQPPLPLLIGDMRCSVKQSLSVGVSGL